MIPLFELQPIKIPGIGLPIQPFGVLMAIGVLVGTHMARRYLDKMKMDDETMRWLGIRILVWGFVACHIIDVLFYEPKKLLTDPLILLKVWEGISSYGGIIGAVIAFFILTRKFDKMNRLRWLDMLNHGVVPGYFFGRVGCAIVHDHIGIATSSPFAVNFDKPRTFQGVLIEGPHHDLGLYEVPVLLIIWILILLIARWQRRPDGLATGLIAILYSVPRFFFEFLRLEVSDPRYLGLTPAQYFSIAVFLAGAWVLVRIFVLKKFTRADQPEEHKMEPRQPAGKSKPPNARGARAFR